MVVLNGFMRPRQTVSQMTWIGSQTPALRTRPVFARGESQTLDPSVQRDPVVVQDLVEIRDGSVGSSLRKGLANAGRFLFTSGLPALGGALAGVPGILAGVALVGTLTYVDSAEKNPAARLRGALLQGAGSGLAAATLGLGSLLAAPLGAAIQGGGAALGAVAAGALDYQAARGQVDYQVKLPRFAKLYQERAEAALDKAGHPEALKGVKSGIAFSPESRKRAAQLQLAKTALIVNHHLGPAAAVALAGEIGREHVNAQALGALSDQSPQLKTETQQTVDGVQVQRLEGFTRTARTQGMALFDRVLLDAELNPESGDALSDFITGHELSHVRHKDSSATLLHQALTGAVGKIAASTSDLGEQSRLRDLSNDLAGAILADSRELEFRADREGLKHALERGHQPSDVLAAAAGLFGEEQSQDAYAPHPSGARRMDALRRSLEG